MFHLFHALGRSAVHHVGVHGCGVRPGAATRLKVLSPPLDDPVVGVKARAAGHEEEGLRVDACQHVSRSSLELSQLRRGAAVEGIPFGARAGARVAIETVLGLIPRLL